MKVVILAGGFGTRISEESQLFEHLKRKIPRIQKEGHEYENFVFKSTV